VDGFAQSVSQTVAKEIRSPDGNFLFRFTQRADDHGKKKMYYEVNYKDTPIILESALSIQLDNHLSQLALALKPVDSGEPWCEDLHYIKESRHSADTVWIPVYGERNLIRDRYNEIVLSFEKAADVRFKLDLIIRVYNEGVAFRFFFPENPTGVYYHIASEDIEFTFPENTSAWYEQWAQGPLQLMPLEGWPDESERPLTLSLASKMYACITEAAMVDYARMKFALKKDKPNTIVTSLYESVDLITYFQTPWRVIMAAEKPGDLIENNDLIENLNAESKIKNTAWIKPGKIIREMTLTNDNAIACIDFASTHNLQYVLFDWKWYGPAFTFDSDARVVAIDLDLKKIIQYGKEKNVGIWLYVNQQALLSQDDEIFPLYKSWGVKGVKYGFVQVGAHRWTNWLHESVKRAADNELMVNIHDEYRTTGEQRTWPNMLTVEGIRGNEEMPDADHNTVLPFTRGIAGAGDYTICYYSPKIKTTHAHQLALGVVNYSPLQTLYWYDKPSDYHGETEIEFFEKLPTVWDETEILKGEIGEYIVTARKKGGEWFVGAITNNTERELTISLDFLASGEKFMMYMYRDDPTVATRTHVRMEKRKISSDDIIKVKLQASGGVALRFVPLKMQE
jgi:alpha-glucosidase